MTDSKRNTAAMAFAIIGEYLFNTTILTEEAIDEAFHANVHNDEFLLGSMLIGLRRECQDKRSDPSSVAGTLSILLDYALGSDDLVYGSDAHDRLEKAIVALNGLMWERGVKNGKE